MNTRDQILIVIGRIEGKLEAYASLLFSLNANTLISGHLMMYPNPYKMWFGKLSVW